MSTPAPKTTTGPDAALSNLMGAAIGTPETSRPAAQDDTLLRNGNTADHQAGWFAGIEQGLANAQHNAQVHAQAEQHAYGAPAEVAARIEQYIAHYGRENTAGLLLYEAMKALRAPAPMTEQRDAQLLGELVVTGVTHEFRPTSEAFDLPSGKYSLYSLAALAAVTRDWKAIQAAINDYLDGYEVRADEGDYTPNKFERFLLDDAIAGLLAEEEFLGLLAASPVGAAGDARDAARYRTIRSLAGLPAAEGHAAAQRSLTAAGLEDIYTPNPDQFDAFADHLIAAQQGKGGAA